jgi:hypothetical protein
MPSHTLNIEALNEAAVALGGTGGHTLYVDALSEIAGLLNLTVKSTSVSNIVTLTQAQYNALAVKDPNTLYVTTA